MELPTITDLPISFKPEEYDSIPYSRHNIFEAETSSPAIESLARVKIREALELRLGRPVVSRDCIAHRFGLRKAGYTSDDLLSGKVLVR